jgi:hypothetical protein
VTNECFLEKKFFDLTNTDEGRVASPLTQYDFKPIFLKTGEFLGSKIVYLNPLIYYFARFFEKCSV